MLQNTDAVKRKRRKYLLTLSCLFGGLMLFLLAMLLFTYNTNVSFFDFLPMAFPWNILILSLIYTMMVACTYSGFYLIINWLKYKPIYLKVLSIVLFPITLALAYFGGVIIFLPYTIFCICKSR
jgi:uncharacterized integral membrane protein